MDLKTSEKLRGQAFSSFLVKILLVSFLIMILVQILVSVQVVPSSASSALIGIGSLFAYSPIFKSIFNKRFGNETIGFYRLNFQVASDSNLQPDSSILSTSKIEQLKSLGRLKETGMLTEEEFNSQKALVLRDS